MKGLINRLNVWLSGLERAITGLTAVLLALLALLVGWQVVARYVLHTGQFWAEEMALVSIMWGTMLGAAGCIWTNDHVRLRFLLEKLPPGPGVWVRAFLNAIIFVFALIIIWEGIHLAERTMSGTLSATGIPVGITYLILPVAGVLMGVFTLVSTVKTLMDHYQDRRDGK